MSFNIALEFRGFTRYLARANNELILWYGSYCDYDAQKIIYMASKEWDGMSDLERKTFIKEETSTNKFFKFLMTKHYSLHKPANDAEIETFSPNQFNIHAKDWRSMTDNEREKFSDVKPSDLGMDYVIKQRDKLHQRYSPRNLNILEFILKTRPKIPKSSRVWFLRTESQHIRSADSMKKWHDLTNDKKSLYERCAVLDSKRYALEKNAWITKIVSTDLENDAYSLSDFELSDIRSRIESLGSIVELSKDLPSLISLKRPRQPFSLFIEAYQYQIRESRSNFSFGPHLRACSEAWKKLTEEEKEFYREESERLKEKRKKLLEKESKASGSKLSVPVDLFSPNKMIFGPCRVSHLYPKLPSIYSFWAKENDVIDKPVKSLWNALSDEEKSKYIEEYNQLKETLYRERNQIDAKHKFVKELLKEAKKLSAYKRELGLIGKSSKKVKNIYN